MAGFPHHQVMSWQAHHIIISMQDCIHTLVLGIEQTKHARFHVHLFGTPDEIHMHLSLIRTYIIAHPHPQKEEKSVYHIIKLVCPYGEHEVSTVDGCKSLSNGVAY